MYPQIVLNIFLIQIFFFRGTCLNWHVKLGLSRATKTWSERNNLIIGPIIMLIIIILLSYVLKCRTYLVFYSDETNLTFRR